MWESCISALKNVHLSGNDQTKQPTQRAGHEGEGAVEFFGYG